MIAWEEARRVKERGGRMVGYNSSVSDDEDDEMDLGSVKSGAMVLGDGMDSRVSCLRSGGTTRQSVK